MATLLQDLADRGLLDSTIVWWSGEFGAHPEGGVGGALERRPQPLRRRASPPWSPAAASRAATWSAPRTRRARRCRAAGVPAGPDRQHVRSCWASTPTARCPTRGAWTSRSWPVRREADRRSRSPAGDHVSAMDRRPVDRCTTCVGWPAWRGHAWLAVALTACLRAPASRTPHRLRLPRRRQAGHRRPGRGRRPDPRGRRRCLRLRRAASRAWSSSTSGR